MADDERHMRPVFDEESRARIRKGLEAYREQHGVGTPTLQSRIAEAIGDNDKVERVPLKTLQRFLEGKHRTDDAFVKHCETFLLAVAPPPPEEIFAEGFSSFLLSDSETDYAPAIGTYWSFITAEEPQGGRAIWMPYSILTLEQTSSKSYLLANEQVHNIARDFQPIESAAEFFDADHTSLGFSGVYVYVERATYMLMLRGLANARVSFLTEMTHVEGGPRYELSGRALEQTGKYMGLAGMRQSFGITYLPEEYVRDISIAEFEEHFPNHFSDVTRSTIGQSKGLH